MTPSPYVCTIDHGFTWAIFVGWIVAVVTGVLLSHFMDRRRFLNGIRSQVAMIREDVEAAHEYGDDFPETSVKAVWKRSLPVIRKAVFEALPYVLIPGDDERLLNYWRSIRDFNVDAFYTRSGSEIVDRVIYMLPTETQKDAFLRTLNGLEDRIP